MPGDNIEAQLKTARVKISEAEDQLGADESVNMRAVETLLTEAGAALSAATDKLGDQGDKRPGYQGQINALKAALAQQKEILKSIPKVGA